MTAVAAALNRDGRWLVAPVSVFLLAMLALPLAIDLVYAVSRVTFETVRHSVLVGLGNFSDVLQEPRFWQALWFSVRFAAGVTLCQVGAGAGLALFLGPLLVRHSWLLTPLMLPMMVAPALVELMYRLILHEFVGVAPYYLQLLTGDSPAFLDPVHAFSALTAIEALQWTPFALLIVHTANQAIPAELREAAAIDGTGPWQCCYGSSCRCWHPRSRWWRRFVSLTASGCSTTSTC